MRDAIRTMLEDFYDAWRHQDFDWLGSYLPSDFRHTIKLPTALYPLAGTRDGKMRVLDHWRRVTQQFDVLQYDITAVAIDDDHAAVELAVRYRHKETGAILETAKTNFWTFEAGWPVTLTEHYNAADLLRFKNDLAALLPDGDTVAAVLGKSPPEESPEDRRVERLS
jgi:ketosteroid isomerase-like protein